MTTLLSIKNLSVSFRIDRDTQYEAVRNISFDIPEKSTVALVGESGSGKSVTSLAIMGLLPKENAKTSADSRVMYKGNNLLTIPASQMQEIRGAEISMIFQEPMSSLNPVFTVGFQLGETLEKHANVSGAEARKRALALLEEVGIPEPQTSIDKYPFQMSGGQQQRVMIAMAIACEPELLIADEPTTALDVTIQRQILDLLAGLQRKRNMSVLFITHDLAVVGDIADHVIVMRHGQIREQGSVKQVFTQPADAYTRALLACRPRVDTRPKVLPVIDDFINAENIEHAVRKESNNGQIAPQVFNPLANIETRTRGIKPDDPVILDVQGLCKSFYTKTGFFSQKEFKAVKDVSFKLRKGKTLGLVGESGSGKTTVGLTLMRLHEATAGKAFLDGKDILAMSEAEFKQYKRRIQIIFQNPYASLNPRFTVGQIVMEPMQLHNIGIDGKDRAGRAFELLARVGLPEASFYKYPHEFSGGQRQRIAIARCLTMKPDILICDESVSALDVSVQAQVLNLLQELQDEYGMSYLFISHDLAVVKYISDEVMVMSNGEVVEQANSDDIYARPQHPYTKKLLSSIPTGMLALNAA
jgi:peptide/nickel transport system ATP-binding protein